MFTKILVCVDGSTCSLAALRTAASIAQHHGAEIVALNVFHPLFAGPAEIGTWTIAMEQDVIERLAREQKEVIEQSIDPIFADLNTPHRVIHEIGHPVEVILRIAAREKVDLIVVGSRGLRGIKELLLGSVSSGVLHHASCPVLIVRGDYDPGNAGTFQNIVLASDGSAGARKAALVAVNMAQKFGTSLTVLNVSVDLSSVDLPGEEEAQAGDMTASMYAMRQLELVRQSVNEVAKDTGVYCSYIQKSGHPYEVIARFIEDHKPDVIVLGSRGLGGFAQMLVGSVSYSVAHHASCPVLVVR